MKSMFVKFWDQYSMCTSRSITAHQDAVTSILELGLKWQNDIGLSSPIWLQKLFRFWGREKDERETIRNRRKYRMRSKREITCSLNLT